MCFGNLKKVTEPQKMSAQKVSEPQGGIQMNEMWSEKLCKQCTDEAASCPSSDPDGKRL